MEYVDRVARDVDRSVSAVEIFDFGMCLLADNDYNLCMVRKIQGAGKLEVVGDYHLGDIITRLQGIPRFLHGSLPMLLRDSAFSFGTAFGTIGVISPLSEEEYSCFYDLQTIMEKWFSLENRTADAIKILDGDLIKTFFDLSLCMKKEISTAMETEVSVYFLSSRVLELKMDLDLMLPNKQPPFY